MKTKLLLLSAFTAVSILSAGETFDKLKPFEGLSYNFGGSISDSDETKVECRASLTAAAEYEINQHISTEGRYTYGLGEHYSSLEAFLKPRYNDFSLLVGYGKTVYEKTNEEFLGMRAGIQYNIAENLYIDVIHRFEEEDTSIGGSFKF